MNLTSKAIDYKSKCLEIVQRYIDATEGSCHESELLADCAYITRAHFEDIIEERACADVCGYVLCGNVLSSRSKGLFKVGQRYHIKNNKVYDITRRRNFCSDLCFMSAEYLRNQISTEPIYMRRGTMPALCLYTEKNGLAGDEVKLQMTVAETDHKEVADKVLKQQEPKPRTKEEIVMKDKTKQSVLREARRIETRVSAPYVKEEEFKELKDQFQKLSVHEKNVDDTMCPITETSVVTPVTEKDAPRPQCDTDTSGQGDTPASNETILLEEDPQKRLEKYRWEYIRLCAKLNQEEHEDEQYDKRVLGKADDKGRKTKQKKKEKKLPGKMKAIINNDEVTNGSEDTKVVESTAENLSEFEATLEKMSSFFQWNLNLN